MGVVASLPDRAWLEAVGDVDGVTTVVWDLEAPAPTQDIDLVVLPYMDASRTAPAVATVSATTGVDRGIRLLSQLNALLAILLALWILVTGETAFLLLGAWRHLGAVVTSRRRGEDPGQLAQLTAAQVRGRILATARRSAGMGGAGIVDPVAAVSAVVAG